MRLGDIINAGNMSDIEITGITADSRNVREGSVFVCIKGRTADGHDFARQAADMGAAAIIAEHDTGIPQQVIVEDTRRAYAVMCANYFGRPADRLKLIGVTGTNGKTTVTFLIKQILEKLGRKSGLIGTIQNMMGDRVLPAKYTTPDPYELNSLISLMLKSGCEYAVMEVSSQALDQQRVYGLQFEQAIFTNFTQDHLDYHGTLENYFAAKKMLFSMCGTAIINKDDQKSGELIDGIKCRVQTYSLKDKSSDFAAENVEIRADGVSYDLVHGGASTRITVGLPGRFSVYNSLAAAASACLLGMPAGDVAGAMSQIGGVKGRMEVVPTGRDFTVIIDYAHTPDALENVCKALDGIKSGRLVTLFGCGGNRDKGKRPLMAKTAAENSDFVIITSDNPRNEEPGGIIKDILTGLEGCDTPYVVVEDRIEAINYAVQHAQKDDIILLAGKGHETYQILKGGKVIELDERKEVAKALSML